ncbi:MAG: PAS domain-containing protein [Pirellulales bacterium]
MKLDGVGEKLPLGSRMIAVADAYDSMTTPQIYRAAFSHERAMSELREHAGKQFDPKLVPEFEHVPTFNPEEFYKNSAKNWLHQIGPRVIDSCWQLQRHSALCEDDTQASLFQKRLLDNMYDAVIFVDVNHAVTFWNRGSERLTGIAPGTVHQRLYSSDLLNMRDERGVAITVIDCPVLYALKLRVQSMRRMLIRGRNGEDLPVNVHTIPVVDDEGLLHGATILLHDATGEVSLEEQCQDWQAGRRSIR